MSTCAVAMSSNYYRKMFQVEVRGKEKKSNLQEPNMRLKFLSPKKVCVTQAMEPFTVSTTENICSSSFEAQKENALLPERIRFLEKGLEKTKKETEKIQK
ncbi:hypothetical protein AVEN_124596-1 [Araneus ventricosus]|uniref:Uncharacterized protein n=1 Tax=Araneus ventricosus TaxID=182803 RepID=A0A4Y2N8E9_ARAVE|nr:hypothetical protein AVEN_124596-1 [Araneus ventricosus]